MKATTSLEFSPQHFQSIFGDEAADWQEFIRINIETFEKGLHDLQAAVKVQDMDVIKEIRHALGPTLQQWSATTLEQNLMALTETTLFSGWPPLVPEFEALLTALKALK